MDLQWTAIRLEPGEKLELARLTIDLDLVNLYVAGV